MAIDYNKLEYNTWYPIYKSLESYFVDKSIDKNIDLLELINSEYSELLDEICELAVLKQDYIINKLLSFGTDVKDLKLDFLKCNLRSDNNIMYYFDCFRVLLNYTQRHLEKELQCVKDLYNNRLDYENSLDVIKSVLNIIQNDYEPFYTEISEFYYKNIGLKICVISHLDIMFDKYSQIEKHTEIFKNKGFELFDYLFKNHIASKKGITESLSYYYWKMLEDDFIHSEQKKFQDWVCEYYDVEPFDRIKSKDKIIKSSSRKFLERNVIYSISIDWFRQSKK